MRVLELPGTVLGALICQSRMKVVCVHKQCFGRKPFPQTGKGQSLMLIEPPGPAPFSHCSWLALHLPRQWYLSQSPDAWGCLEHFNSVIGVCLVILCDVLIQTFGGWNRRSTYYQNLSALSEM